MVNKMSNVPKLWMKKTWYVQDLAAGEEQILQKKKKHLMLTTHKKERKTIKHWPNVLQSSQNGQVKFLEHLGLMKTLVA